MVIIFYRKKIPIFSCEVDFALNFSEFEIRSHTNCYSFYIICSKKSFQYSSVVQYLTVVVSLQEKSKRLQYDRANLQRAYDAFRNQNISVYEAARIYGVPERTLRDRFSGNVALDCKVGHETLFDFQEEKDFVEHLKYMAEIGYGYTKSMVQTMGMEYAQALNKTLSTRLDDQTKLSNNWFYGLMKRWPELKLVKPQKLSLARAKSTSDEKLSNYFRELSSILTRNGLTDKPNRI